MGMKARQNPTDSPRVEVGEIDTRAPFESVKAAVSLFGEVAFSVEKSTATKAKLPSIESTLAKETQLHLTQKELNKLKEQLNNAETTRIQALSELESSKKTIDVLTRMLNSINESKELALKTTEAAKTQTKQHEEVSSNNCTGNDGAWRQELDGARELYVVAISELNAAKQELRRIRNDFEASMDAKTFAIHQEGEAKQLSNSNMEKATQLSKEIATVQESLMHVKFSIEQAQLDESNIISEKAAGWPSYRPSLDETEEKLTVLKKVIDHKLNADPEAKLVETTSEIGAIQKKLESIRISNSDLITAITAELDGITELLQKIAEEETSIRSLVDSLKVELGALKKEHNELKEKDAETESIVGGLHIKLRKSKADLEAAIAAESKATSECNELILTLQKLSSESEIALQEAEETKKKAGDLRKDADAARAILDEAEMKLQATLREAEEAKKDETGALDQIKELSEKANVAHALTSNSGANITISKEEYESLRRKLEESEKLAEMKVDAAKAQVEAVKASENEAIKLLEASWKESEEVGIAIEEALKRAEMAEAAKKVVEGELHRRREREQKKAVEAAARILADTQQVTVGALPAGSRVPKTGPLDRTDGKLEAGKESTLKKTLLPKFSGIFNWKKNPVDGGSLSYLAGEKSVEVRRMAGAGKGKGRLFDEGGPKVPKVAEVRQQVGLKILTKDDELKVSQVITRARISNDKKIGFSLAKISA